MYGTVAGYGGAMTGVAVGELSIDNLLHELDNLYRTRQETLRHGSAHALQASTSRIAELEREYLHRFPDREVDPERLRSGARERT